MGSVHGWGCPMPWLAEVEVTFTIEGGGSGGGGGGGGGGGSGAKLRSVQGGRLDKGPFKWRRRCPLLNELGDGPRQRLVAHVSLTFGEGCTARGAQLEYVVGLGAMGAVTAAASAAAGAEYSFEVGGASTV